ncbi:MAG: hypothetical protein U0166_23235 [Acidobacteriota bacterium]
MGRRRSSSRNATSAELRGRLQKLGLLTESGHGHLAGNLVVPVFDGEGLRGADVPPQDDRRPAARDVLHLNLPRPLRGAWNASALAGQEEALVCEAVIDAMTFWCAGFRNGLASFEAKGFESDHLAAL